ncbi:DUF1592 domain-containing protein [Luteolibacter sp. SL250]|uniref:DUF1592 domain-containing protein n=1 Tax=Luteolibacter sp. SL250 TaxID=2995170 RepID=UPI00226EA3E1|nr:DUF1592 domain-containing protein [Luteolibacter sp. SL250]WAC19816.1 DUF1592 domain-containing protein [Luteolibacter sp. SL250]
MPFPRTILAFSLLCAASSHAADDGGFTERAAEFFANRCTDCHDSETKEGGLDLTKIGPDMAGHTDLWTNIYDRVKSGEMPPKKRKNRPEPEEIQGLLKWIEPRLAQADQQQREVYLRRLNRTEYRNTIRDLLGVDRDFSGTLPEDQKAGGFDNNGKALAISADQMEAYLTAASVALDQALKPGEKPVTHKVVVDPAPELLEHITKYPTNSYAIVDGMAATFRTERGTYSQIATRQNVTKKAGRYRFKFQAKALNTTKDLVFAIRNYGSASGSGNPGYLEVGPELKTFEFEMDMGSYSPIQFFAMGLPYLPDKAKGAANPGIAFGKVEMTGPLAPVWPPASYTRVLGKLDVTKATAPDALPVLEKFMARAFRRPLQPGETDRYLALVSARMEAGASFTESLRAGMLAVLCSPNFLYLREDMRPGEARVTDTELASRLSYFLWSSMPDAELLELAAANKLRDPKVLHAQVERLLADERSEQFVRNFTGQWLHLREINATTPDAKVYPDYDDLLQYSMVEESRTFFREILNRDLPVVNFIDSQFAILNGRLAQHYGIPGVEGMALRPVRLPKDSVRGGVLTQASVLKVTANGSYTSPVVRGAWVLESILGRPSPPPPPNINGIEPDIRGATTMRQLLEKHREDSSCASCHQHIDPPGFALEDFDPTGAFRTHYVNYEAGDGEKEKGRLVNGPPVDATGVLTDGRTFSGIAGFKKLLLATGRDDFRRCLTQKLMTYGLGRELGFSDRPAVARIMNESSVKGDGLRTLVHLIVSSETFSNR